MSLCVCVVNHSGGLCFISILSQRSGGGVQHYTLSSPTLLSVSAGLTSEEGHLLQLKKTNGNDTTFYFLFFNHGNIRDCATFTPTLTSVLVAFLRQRSRYLTSTPDQRFVYFPPGFTALRKDAHPVAVCRTLARVFGARTPKVHRVVCGTLSFWAFLG